MKKYKSHFEFTKQERSGIFYLLLFIITLQLGYYAYSNLSPKDAEERFVVNTEEQAKIDILKKESLAKENYSVFPFNPNFISDYKGYTLGMSVQEIDRLHVFREKNRFVDSGEEFQEVTKVSDSLLNKLQPLFKFPEWKKKMKKINTYSKVKTFAVKDINSCTEEELQSISGIGEVLSKRIVKFRNTLGGFLIDAQLYDVYGLKPEVAGKVLVQFKVIKIPLIKKININRATASELSKLVYIQKRVSFELINYRIRNDSITSFDELVNVKNFPFEKIDKIKLYLKLR